MNNRPTIQILKRWLEDKASPEERARIDKWYNHESAARIMPIADKENVREQLYQRIIAELEAGPKIIPLYKRPFFRVAVAASILIAIATLTYLVMPTKEASQTQPTAKTGDVPAPDKTKATITLADGRTVTIDSLTSLTQGNVNIVKNANGEIVYNGSSAEIVYNTLYNPRGSKVVNLTLSDGTKVWLNSESSLKYPTAFAGDTRAVEITGEAYFEIAHDKTKPFYVSKGDMNVQVLGTHFNVNAYDDEKDIRVTLLEGSVKVSNDVDSKIIKPGQQAAAVSHSPFTIQHSPDLEQVMAWKNGLFSFNRADIKTVMRQLARWYDVDVSFEGNVPQQLFGGEIQRTVALSKVLENLEKYGVRSRIENKKIIVLP